MGKLLEVWKQWFDNNQKETHLKADVIKDTVNNITGNKEQKPVETPVQEKPIEMPKAPENFVVPEVKDTSNENLEENVNGSTAKSVPNWQKYMEEQQAKQWAREDAIRKETQAREDSAVQRWAEDARKAGVNINLTGAGEAQSGGGITSATGMDYTPYQEEMDKYLKELEIELEQAFKGAENEKERLSDKIGQILQTALNLGAMLLLRK